MDRRFVVAEVQRQLASRGYYRGRVDGRYGRRTAFAVRAYQWRAGIPPTGQLDTATLNAMGLSDWNVAYLESAPWQDGSWAPMREFKDEKWREKWEKRYRDDADDEYDEGDLYGIWERADKEFKYGKREEEWEKKREEGWKKQQEERKKWEEEWNKQAGDWGRSGRSITTNMVTRMERGMVISRIIRQRSRSDRI